GVTDKEDGLAFVTGHAHGEVVGGGVFRHHPGGEHEDASAAELHYFALALFEHDEIVRFVKLQVRVLAVRAVGFEIVDFGEHAAQSADVNRLPFQFPLAHQQRE